MRIVVLNFHKHRRALGVLRLVAICLVLIIAMAIGIDAYFNSSEYIAVLHRQSEENTIIIDAGHGGEDPGAIGVNGVYEKDLNLAVALEVGRILSEKGFAVIYTRTDDKLLYTEEENIRGIRKISDLKNRCKIAAEYPNAIFVSIHMNSYGSEKYSGTQVYYSTENENSQILANAIQGNVKESLQSENSRVIKEGKGMYIMENLTNAAVLIECGFLTNSAECEKLCEKEYQKELSLSIVCGIIKYKEKISSH